ncbi:MAG: zinc ribbon domain-containing protein [Candidatus Omnitrophica bacterium]|nr:zinc ribbon domain-containing protein [Candidatus Omnitrophota bacterium]MCF7876880.1 zinc ribbon domain-containing protein [Candidatus Omnitrophota bacterium]MCF7877947.1 zinc ribbon domain-containing protein [Candidatus Omnitrophota bacterium]MCF7892694.1 zinc ribbon domain-containing protein [Candidatus Omnitrophota bacterium]
MPEGFFQYYQENEQEEDLDFNHLVKCPHCGKPIPQDATSCYYCGKDAIVRKKSKRVGWLILFLIVLLISYFIIF